jgi:raffinose/stachyose/melibiose transport system substrate-binding protein
MSELRAAQPDPRRPSRRSVLGGLGLTVGGLAGLGVAAPAASLLTGCGTSGELGRRRDSGPGGGQGGASPSRLSMIGVAQPNPGRGFTKLLDDYKKAEGVETKYQYFPSERFVALFTAAQRAGQPLDVLLLNGQDIRRYATNGTLLPLEVDYTDRFRPLGPKTYTIDGKLWGIPTGGQGGFMILYNKKLLDDIGATYPQTYADLRDIGTELAKKDIATFTHPGKNVYLWPVWFFTTYAQTTKNKSEEKTIALLTGEGSFTDPEAVEALDLIFAFHRDGLFAKDVLSVDTDGSMANMQRSKAAFWLGGDYGGISQDHPEGVDPRLEVLPRLVSDTAVTSQFPGGPGSPLCLYKDIPEANKDAALELIDYLSSDASASYLVKDGHGAFTTNANAEGSDDPVAKDAVKYIDQMTVYLDWYWPPEITAAFQQGIQAGVAGTKDADAVAADIQSTWEKVQQGGWKFS